MKFYNLPFATRPSSTHLFRLIVGILGISLLATTTAFTQELKPVSITYTISLESDRYGNATLGKIETTLNKDGNRYSVLSQTKAEGLAVMIMGSNHQESCDFSLEDGRVVSNNYSGGRSGTNDYQVTFDWQQKKISLEDGESLDMPQGYIIDNCNQLFAASLFAKKGIEDESLYIIDGRNKKRRIRVRGYRLKSSKKEQLETRIGNFNTSKIVLQRELDPEKTITLWLSDQHDHLPLKMVEQRRKRTTIFTVDELTPG